MIGGRIMLVWCTVAINVIYALIWIRTRVQDMDNVFIYGPSKVDHLFPSARKHRICLSTDDHRFKDDSRAVASRNKIDNAGDFCSVIA